MQGEFVLEPRAVTLVSACDKPTIFAALAEVFARAYGIDAGQVLEALEEREALGSTGFGRGVALPHARIDTISRPRAALLKLAEPVDYAAADAMPVDLVFGLLSPSDSGAAHLHALAAMSRLMRDDAVHEALAGAEDADALFAVFTNLDTRRDAA